MERLQAAAWLACFGLVVACGSGPRAVAKPGSGSANAENDPPLDTKPKPVPEIELDALRIKVVKGADGKDELIHYDARMLLDQGNTALNDKRFDEALPFYEQLIREFPRSSIVPIAVYNIGLVLESRGDWDGAIARYRDVVKKMPNGPASIDAHMRIAVVLSERFRWSEATAVFEDLLARSDLTPTDRIEGVARLGYVLVEQKAYARAEAVLQEGVRYAQSVAQTSHLETDYFATMCHYYLANIPHRQARAVPLRIAGPAGDDQLTKDLQAKRVLLKLAYDRYVRAMRQRNPYWATAAAYQMSHMFKELWDQVVLAPTPPRLSSEASGLYKKELHKKIRSYLTRAMEGHVANVRLAKAYRNPTEWSEASKLRSQQIAEILAKESAGELVTPPREVRATIVKPESRSSAGADDGYVPGRVEL